MKNPQDGNLIPDKVDAVVIGGSQAGLSVSFWLKQSGYSHVVLEKDVVGSSWINKRWESFCLVTPNWMIQLPGYPYQGDNPDGFILRDEIVQYLEDYAENIEAPIHTNTEVTRLARNGNGFLVDTTSGSIAARSVFVCVGYFHEGKLPNCSTNLNPEILQLHSRNYINPDQLQEGGVLVVGSGQSGAQIAEEIHLSGRPTWLSVSSAVRDTRTYRGKDGNYWFNLMGGFDKSFEDINDPKERYRPNPHCSGKDGGRALNLEKFAIDGINLVGRVADINDTEIMFEENMIENVRRADSMAIEFMKEIDDMILERGIDAETVSQTNTDDGTPATRPDLRETARFNLVDQGITNIVWATGWYGKYDWIDFPVLDERQYPGQVRGVTQTPGLYFCGLHWMHCLKSGLFFGVGEDAQFVVDHLREQL
jgi:putative flavoprotein involved in K+ transport